MKNYSLEELIAKNNSTWCYGYRSGINPRNRGSTISGTLCYHPMSLLPHLS
jgi:hypothetical protein